MSIHGQPRMPCLHSSVVSPAIVPGLQRLNQVSQFNQDRGHEYTILGGGFKDFFIFTPKIGEDEPILTHIMFSIGFVQPPTRF